MTWAGWMRRCASFMAMRRISCIDHRIRSDVSCEGAAAFFERHDIGPMADDGDHGEGQHDQRDMTVPAMPGTAFVVIEAEFVLGGFEAVLDSPAMAFDQHQLLHGRAFGAPGGEEGPIAVGNVA